MLAGRSDGQISASPRAAYRELRGGTMIRFSNTDPIDSTLPQTGAFALAKPVPLFPSQNLPIHYLIGRDHLGEVQSSSSRASG